jgi:hypothetical protein
MMAEQRPTEAVKKTSAELKTMTEAQFLTYYRGEEIAWTEQLEKDAAWEAELREFDNTRPQPLNATDRAARAAIFTKYGKTPP